MILPCSGDITLFPEDSMPICDADALAIIGNALQPICLPAYFSAEEFLEEMECRFTLVALRLLGGAL